jgi:hypothetical protein
MMTINGVRAMSSPVVRSRNVFKRNSMRFAAALLAALAIFVAGPNAALAAPHQHHDQVPGFYRLQVGDLEVTALFDGPAVVDPNWLKGTKATVDAAVEAVNYALGWRLLACSRPPGRWPAQSIQACFPVLIQSTALKIRIAPESRTP